MAIGNNVPAMGYESVVGIAKEIAFGTFVTSTTFLEFNTESLKHNIEMIKVETINGTRDLKRIMQGNTVVDGSLEFPFNPASDAVINIFKQAFGGTLSSAAASGTTSYTHTLNTGNMEDNKVSGDEMVSLSIAVRPGATTGAITAPKTWCFFGCRVNSLSIKAEAGSPVMITAEIIGKGCSLSSTMPAASFADINPVNFTGITYQTGATLTALSAEYIKSFELTLNNNINTDHRVLGSREVVQLPPVARDITLKITQVFDTTTAYDTFLANTATAIQIVMNAEQMEGASASSKYTCTVSLPKCYLAGFTPAVKDKGPIIQDLEYTCIYSGATAAAFSAQMTIKNRTASYD